MKVNSFYIYFTLPSAFFLCFYFKNMEYGITQGLQERDSLLILVHENIISHIYHVLSTSKIHFSMCLLKNIFAILHIVIVFTLLFIIIENP